MPALEHQRAFNNWAGGTYPQASDTQAMLGPQPLFRDAKDRQLASFGASPDTNYPDGYLGIQPATSRRSDKLLDAVSRVNRPAYTRGVHKGERINPGDYTFPVEFNMNTSLELMARAKRVVTKDPLLEISFLSGVTSSLR